MATFRVFLYVEKIPSIPKVGNKKEGTIENNLILSDSSGLFSASAIVTALRKRTREKINPKTNKALLILFTIAFPSAKEYRGK